MASADTPTTAAASAEPIAARRGPRVLRVKTVSETGYPYEIHHLVGPAPATLPESADPVGAAEAALGALSADFAAWLRADMARLRSALTDYRETRGEDPMGLLWSRLHELRGNAAMMGREDVSHRAEAVGALLERGTAERRLVIQAVEALIESA